jgi:hypothetical protein
VAKKEPVNINIQTVLALIPIVGLWAAYKIEKFRFWILLNIGFFAMEFSFGEFVDYPYNFVVILPLELTISAYLMRSWSREWNAKVSV